MNQNFELKSLVSSTGCFSYGPNGTMGCANSGFIHSAASLAYSEKGAARTWQTLLDAATRAGRVAGRRNVRLVNGQAALPFERAKVELFVIHFGRTRFTLGLLDGTETDRSTATTMLFAFLGNIVLVANESVLQEQ